DLWPARKLLLADATRQARAVLDALDRRGLARAPRESAAREALIASVVGAILPATDMLVREYAYQRNREFERELGAMVTDPDDPAYAPQQAKWRVHVRRLDGDLVDRAAGTFTRLAIEEFVARADGADPKALALVREVRALRERPAAK